MSEKTNPFDSSNAPAEKIGPYNKPATDLQELADDFRAMQPKLDAAGGKPGRLPWDYYFLKLAELVSTRATCDRAHMGCVLVKDNIIVATGYNGSIKGLPHCNDWTHDLSRDPDHWTSKLSTAAKAAIRSSEFGYVCPCGAKGTWKKIAKLPCTSPVDKGAGHLMEDGHCVRTVHAEQNALAQCAKLGKAADGATAYINGFPCWRCFMLLANAGIVRIVYSKAYRNDPKVIDSAAAAGINLINVEV